MWNHRVLRIWLLAFVALAATACSGSAPTPTAVASNPTNHPTVAPTMSPMLVQTASFTPSVTRTPRPTSTVTPTPSPTATPTLTVTPTFTPLPVIVPETMDGLSLMIERVREAQNLADRKPFTPAQSFLVMDVMLTNVGSERKCLNDVDLRINYPSGSNEDGLTIPNLDDIVSALKKADPTYTDWDFVKPNHVWVTARKLNFCVEADSSKRTVLVYSVPEGWAYIMMRLGEKDYTQVAMCLVRSDQVQGGFREVLVTRDCELKYAWEQISETYLPPDKSFFYAEEVPVSNCDSQFETTVQRGADLPQPPVAEIAAKNDWASLAETLLPDELKINVPIAPVELTYDIERHHGLEAGKPWITVTTSITKTVPGGMEAKYRFMWREVSVKGVIVVDVDSKTGYTIYRSRIPYEIRGQVRLDVTTEYERPCKPKS